MTERESERAVLYMEDDPGLARLLQKKLEQAGYVVDLARDGEEGLAMSAAASYDVLLVDQNMPVHDGLSVIRTLVVQGSEVPVVMVTGAGSEAIAVEAMKLGARDYVVKDVEGRYWELLPTVIEKVLEQQRVAEETKRADEALRESEALLRQVIDTNPNCIFVKDRQGKYVLVNKAIVELYGTTRETMVGKTDLEFAKLNSLEVEEARQFVSDDLEAINSGQAKFIPEEAFTRPDGTVRWFQTTKVPLSLRGAGDCLLGVAVDITERKWAAEERVTLEERLRQKQKLEAVGQLAGGVAHEFNNMMTVIQGNTELAQMEVDADHPIYGELSAIHRAARRAAKLTQQLLALGRRQMLLPRVLDVNELIRDFGAPLQDVVGERVELHLVLGVGVGTMMADPQAVQEVLINLALNATDAMPEGGRLRVETAAVTVDEAYGVIHPEAAPGEYVRLSVSDTGVGMDEATRERLFEPFFTTKGVGKGTGLGLAAVYGIVRQHGGWIEVESKVGAGTKFVVYLARGEVQRPEHSSAALGMQQVWRELMVGRKGGAAPQAPALPRAAGLPRLRK